MVRTKMAKVVLTSLKEKNFSSKDIDNAVSRAIDRLDFDFKSKKIENVVIKPNLCFYWDYSTGETTDPRVVSAVIDYVRSRLGNDVNVCVVEADASAMKTEHSFKILGYEQLSTAKNVDLVNLSEGEVVEQKVRVKEKEFSLPVNSILFKADLLINVPKLKTHNVAGATCALKNTFGAISKPQKYSYHDMLPYVIVAANKLIKSHMVVVDGVIVHGAYPKKLGVVIAGDDPLATDFVAAEIMGFNPRRIPYLRMAEHEQIGHTNDIGLIENEVKLNDVKRRFPSYNHFIHRLFWSLQLRMLGLYAVIVDDVIPPVLQG
jgi:uncharacterized protein (DUF362 family)